MIKLLAPLLTTKSNTNAMHPLMWYRVARYCKNKETYLELRQLCYGYSSFRNSRDYFGTGGLLSVVITITRSFQDSKYCLDKVWSKKNPQINKLATTYQHRLRSGIGHIPNTQCGPRLWNRLPLKIREAPSVSVFKCQLKTYLFPKCWFFSFLCVCISLYFLSLYMWHDQGEWVGCRQCCFWDIGKNCVKIPLFYIVFSIDKFFITL